MTRMPSSGPGTRASLVECRRSSVVGRMSSSRPMLADVGGGSAPERALVARHEILAEDVRLHVQLVEPLLDHVADAHDAAEPAALDHGKVAHAVVGHAGHDRG